MGDHDDGESLTAATRGVDGVFYMQLAPLPAQAEYMVQAAKAAGINKLVLLSSLRTVLQPMPMIGARIAARDEVFRQSGLDVTYWRASGLMSNAQPRNFGLRRCEAVPSQRDGGFAFGVGEELAEEFGVSRERVRQIEVRAFEKVQKAVRNRVAAMESPPTQPELAMH